ncbi:MAG: VOC family protein [Candidatus Hatepunaea meridiana]|nr:VOC family protein [Candidatus Hatepunaea meridiana]
MGNPVVHFEICVKDMEKAHEFYGQLFDWELKKDAMEDYTIIEVGEGGGIGGGIMKAEEGKFPPYVAFYVSVDDLEASVKKAEELGATIIVPPTPIPNVGRFAMFNDLDGNMIGLWSK